MIVFKKLHSAYNFLILITLLIFATSVSSEDFSGRYCELDGARTSSGECYFWSDRYGDLEGARTSSGQSVTGSCYRYSDQYAELDGARTSTGESVRGDCYIY